jgi:hypothetical protein
MASQALVDDGMADNATDATQPGIARRAPYWLVAVGLLALLALLLAGGLALDRRFRPRVGVETAGIASTQTDPAAPGQAGIGMANKNVDVQFTTSLPTSSPEREIAQAYIRSWQVYAEAMYTHDTSKLPEVAARDFLQLCLNDVQQRKARGRATSVQVKLDFYLFDVKENTASVWDEYENSSYVIDATTKDPIGEPGQPERITDVYFLEKVGGVWKVVNMARQGP